MIFLEDLFSLTKLFLLGSSSPTTFDEASVNFHKKTPKKLQALPRLNEKVNRELLCNDSGTTSSTRHDEAAKTIKIKTLMLA